MNKTERETARTVLLALRETLSDLAGTNALDRAVVELDQQSVGRLSRMDAMQQQAIAEETNRRRTLELRKIEAALVRLDQDEYGYCVKCGEEIAPKRLDLDPTAALCAECAK